MNQKLYDILSWIGRILLPSFAVLYTTIGKIWNLPFVEEIPLTFTSLSVFVNAILKVESNSYFSTDEEEKG